MWGWTGKGCKKAQPQLLLDQPPQDMHGTVFNLATAANMSQHLWTGLIAPQDFVASQLRTTDLTYWAFCL